MAFQVVKIETHTFAQSAQCSKQLFTSIDICAVSLKTHMQSEGGQPVNLPVPYVVPSLVGACGRVKNRIKVFRMSITNARGFEEIACRV
ncbi:hypothetical protein PoB_006027200 [Plakobranchus ocellatus]|uniref:Uncharacterized protein n=1 Tax=Plakobranchus ocellatus TaxID=259542 RepID=A0AAV4CPE2_9GAST|nr:hypothetical protein PoB_006027200 [Plakobranchus ocellatus]